MNLHFNTQFDNSPLIPVKLWKSLNLLTVKNHTHFLMMKTNCFEAIPTLSMNQWGVKRVSDNSTLLGRQKEDALGIIQLWFDQSIIDFMLSWTPHHSASLVLWDNGEDRTLTIMSVLLFSDQRLSKVSFENNKLLTGLKY